MWGVNVGRIADQTFLSDSLARHQARSSLAMPLGHTHMALDGPETNLHIVYASSIIDQHKEEVFEQYDFAGPVASCKVEEVSTDAAAAYRARHGLVAGQPGIKAISETRS